MKYIINSSLLCHKLKNDGLVLSVSGKDILCIENGEKEILEILKVFSAPKSINDAFTQVNQFFYISKGKFEEIFRTLKENNIIKESKKEETTILTSYHLEKYKRQISSLSSLPNIEYNDAITIQNKICKAKVCIIGLGGTGSHLSLALASMGVENLVLIDYDVVELSNTSRQVLYSENDVGKDKIEVATEKLKTYNSKLHISAFKTYVNSEEDLEFLKNIKGIDLLILCADTPRGKIQFIVDKVAQKYSIPWFAYGPYNHSQILAGPYIVPNVTKKYSDIFDESEILENDDIKTINDKFVASICDPYNGFASMFAAIEVFKILGGHTNTLLLNRRYYVNTDTWGVEYIDYEK